MAINLYNVYNPNNIDNSDTTNYPIGKARNESVDGAKDYFPVEAVWINELLGFLGAIVTAASGTPSGNAERAGSSQYLDWLRSLSVSVSRLSSGYVTVSSAGITFGDSTMGANVFSGSPADAAKFESRSPNTKTYQHTMQLKGGGLEFIGGTGVDHEMFNIQHSIGIGDLNFVSSSPFNLLQMNTSQTFTGVNYHVPRGLELVLYNSSTDVALNLPMVGEWKNNAGELQLYWAQVILPWASITLSDYNAVFASFWVDPAYIT